MIQVEPLRLRVQLTKRENARFLSHAEFSRTLMLAARRAGLPVHYAGMHMSRMKVSLSPPLPIGPTSECELVDFFLASYVSPEEAARALGASLPRGIGVVSCRLMSPGGRPVGKIIDTAVYRVTLPSGAGTEGDWRQAVKEFMGKELINFERVQPRRTRIIDIRSGVHGLEAEVTDADRIELRMVLDDGTRGTIKPSEVLKVLAEMAGGWKVEWEETAVVREGLFVRRGDRLVSPLELERGKPAVRDRRGRY